MRQSFRFSRVTTGVRLKTSQVHHAARTKSLRRPGKNPAWSPTPSSVQRASTSSVWRKRAFPFDNRCVALAISFALPKRLTPKSETTSGVPGAPQFPIISEVLFQNVEEFIPSGSDFHWTGPIKTAGHTRVRPPKIYRDVKPAAGRLTKGTAAPAGPP